MGHTKPHSRKRGTPAPAHDASNGNGKPSANGNGAAHLMSDVQDLAELFENERATVILWDPRDIYVKEKRDTGFRIEIAPLWSDEAREVAEANKDRVKFIDGVPDLTDQGLQDSLFEQIVTVTKRWWKVGESPDGIVLHGEFLACTPENVRKVYTHPKLRWIYAHVQAAYLDRARFFGVPPKTV